MERSGGNHLRGFVGSANTKLGGQASSGAKHMISFARFMSS